MGLRSASGIRIIRNKVSDVPDTASALSMPKNASVSRRLLRCLRAPAPTAGEEFSRDMLSTLWLHGALDYAKLWPNTTAGADVMNSAERMNHFVSRFFKLNPEEHNSLFFRFRSTTLELELENSHSFSVFLRDPGEGQNSRGDYRCETRWIDSKFRFFGPSSLLPRGRYAELEKSAQSNFLITLLLLDQLLDPKTGLPLLEELKKFQVPTELMRGNP
jgi:hypothetical protein